MDSNPDQQKIKPEVLLCVVEKFILFGYNHLNKSVFCGGK